MTAPALHPFLARLRELPIGWRWIVALVLTVVAVGLTFGPPAAMVFGLWHFYFTPQGLLEILGLGLALAMALGLTLKPLLPSIRARLSNAPGQLRWKRRSPWALAAGLYWIAASSVALAYIGVVRGTAPETEAVYRVTRVDDCTRRCAFCRTQFQVRGWPGMRHTAFCAEDLPAALQRRDRVRFIVQANDRAIFVRELAIVPRADPRVSR